MTRGPKKKYCKSSLKHNQIFLYFIDNFILNLVIYVYLRPLPAPAPAPAPATSTRESRPATFRQTPPHPILENNSGYTRPTLFAEWGEGLDLCELENALEMHSVPRLVHDCRQAKILMTIGQHVKTFSSPQLMIAFQNTGKRSDSQHHG